MTHQIATVISYCSRERVYIDATIRNARAFSHVIVLVVGTLLYDGTPEDEDHLSRVGQDHPDVLIERYNVTKEEIHAPIPLHNRAREQGVLRARSACLQAGQPDSESKLWFLFLDGDEVPDGERFSRWCRAAAAQRVFENTHVAFKLQNYWLFMLPRLVSKTHEDSILLVHDSQLTPASLRHPRERDGIIIVQQQQQQQQVTGPPPLQHVLRDVKGADGMPMFWHYSWVREDRDALKAKVTTWGHKSDRTDWARLVDDACDAAVEGRVPAKDFVHGYDLYWVKPDDLDHPQPPVVW